MQIFALVKTKNKKKKNKRTKNSKIKRKIYTNNYWSWEQVFRTYQQVDERNSKMFCAILSRAELYTHDTYDDSLFLINSFIRFIPTRANAIIISII